MLKDSTQNEKYISPLFSSDFTMKIEATKYSKINASKFEDIKVFSKYWKTEITTQINKEKRAINLAFKIPKNKGIVCTFWASYFKSLISKGIVIAKTNKNRDNKCNTILCEIGMSFSSTNKSIVLTVQTKEMIKILLNGIFLNPKGYKTESKPTITITIWVINWNSKKR